MPLVKVAQRVADRGCCKPIHREVANVEDQNEIDVNTKKLLQDEVNELYTGHQISSHYVYAQNFSYFWCVLTFSTGLPILYPFAFLFYLLLFWVYKLLLLKFYQRTNRFNEELPIKSLSYMKVGLILHLLVGGFMVTYSELLPRDSQEQFDGFTESLAAETDNPFLSKVLERFTAREQGVLYLVSIIIFSLLIILKNSLFTLIYRVLKLIARTCYSCMCSVCAGPLETEKESQSKDFFLDLNLHFLESLLVRANLEKERFQKYREKVVDLHTKVKDGRF
mmetsp:Transcript_1780/g.3134  ORF Transcript_1780/g.3134 Transcript_1780/m.3134 type:complete len:279 (-) Transcript_1780:417-1253(-)